MIVETVVCPAFALIEFGFREICIQFESNLCRSYFASTVFHRNAAYFIHNNSLQKKHLLHSD